jgi:uncharacterized membrane protein YidH (DUF202 family)
MNNLQWVALLLMIVPICLTVLCSINYYDPETYPKFHVLNTTAKYISYGLVAVCAFLVILLGA